MKQVTINKDELRATVQGNRDEHRSTFVKAIEGYRKAAVEFFNEQLDRAKAGRSFQVMFNEPVPSDHTNDYDVVLEMLEMEVGNEVVLSFSEFKQYVRDEWGWKQEWAATTSNYLLDR